MPMAVSLFEQPQNHLKMWERDGLDHLLKLYKVVVNRIQCFVFLSLLNEKSNSYAVFCLKKKTVRLSTDVLRCHEVWAACTPSNPVPAACAAQTYTCSL